MSLLALGEWAMLADPLNVREKAVFAALDRTTDLTRRASLNRALERIASERNMRHIVNALNGTGSIISGRIE